MSTVLPFRAASPQDGLPREFVHSVTPLASQLVTPPSSGDEREEQRLSVVEAQGRQLARHVRFEETNQKHEVT